MIRCICNNFLTANVYLYLKFIQGNDLLFQLQGKTLLGLSIQTGSGQGNRFSGYTMNGNHAILIDRNILTA